MGRNLPLPIDLNEGVDIERTLGRIVILDGLIILIIDLHRGRIHAYFQHTRGLALVLSFSHAGSAHDSGRTFIAPACQSVLGRRSY